MALTARNKKALTELFNNLRAEAKLMGLYINKDETKYIHIKRTDPRNTHIHNQYGVDGQDDQEGRWSDDVCNDRKALHVKNWMKLVLNRKAEKATPHTRL